MDKEPSESKQTAEETAPGAAPAGKEIPNQQKPVEGGSEETAGGDKPDYARLLEEERARTKRAEDKIVKLKKTAHRADSDDSADDSDDSREDSVAKTVSEHVSKIRDEIRSEIVGSEVDDLVNEFSSDASERELIRHIYDNRLVKTGFSRAAIRDDLANAKLMANRDSILRTNRELAESLKSKASVDGSKSTSSSARPGVEQKPAMSEQDRKIMARIEAIKKK